MNYSSKWVILEQRMLLRLHLSIGYKCIVMAGAILVILMLCYYLVMHPILAAQRQVNIATRDTRLELNRVQSTYRTLADVYRRLDNYPFAGMGGAPWPDYSQRLEVSLIRYCRKHGISCGLVFHRSLLKARFNGCFAEIQALLLYLFNRPEIIGIEEVDMGLEPSHRFDNRQRIALQLVVRIN